MNRKAVVIITILFAAFTSPVFSQQPVSRTVVYTQPFDYKKSPGYGDYASLMIEDSASGKKMVVLRDNKTVTFSLLDRSWKLLSSFETSIDKKSPYHSNSPRVANYTIDGDVWTTIVEGTGMYGVEKVDFGKKNYQFSGKIFEDMDKDYNNRSFQLNGNTYNIYVTKKDEVNMALINAAGKVQVNTLDLSTQVTAGKKKLKPEVIFENIGMMGGRLVESPEWTRKKFLYYVAYESFIISAVYEQPFAELIYFDWQTGKRIRSDIFSVQDLLPADARNDDLNTTVLLFDNKVWVQSAYKHGGVLGVFDRNTKKLLYQFLYNDNTPKETFSYGPVFYKAVPGTVSGFKEKLEDVSMDFFCKEAFKRHTALTVHETGMNEYIVSLGGYDEITVSTDRWKRMGPSLSGGFPEKVAAGLTFRKNDFKAITSKTTYNSLNKLDLSGKYEKPNKKTVNNTPPEYEEKRAISLSTHFSNTSRFDLYFFEGQFKIMETVYE